MRSLASGILLSIDFNVPMYELLYEGEAYLSVAACNCNTPLISLRIKDVKSAAVSTTH